MILEIIVGNWRMVSERRHLGLFNIIGNAAYVEPFSRSMTFFDQIFDKDDGTDKFFILHEFGHTFDYADDWNNPRSLGAFRDEFWPCCTRYGAKCFPFGFKFHGIQGTPASDYAKSNTMEDFAETFATFVWMENDWDFSAEVWTFTQIPDSDRLDYMKNQFLGNQ